MMRAQSPFAGPLEASRVASLRSVARSAGVCPVAPRARRIPSMVAQFSPASFAAALRFFANFGDSRSAGGVGSGSCEFSQIVAALGGPSISGAGAGLSFGTISVRSCFFVQPRVFAFIQPRVSARLAFGGLFGGCEPAVEYG